MEKKVLCGRSSLRVLFRKHPELRETLGFHRFDRPGLSGGARLNLERAVFALLFTPPVAALVKPFATLPLGEFTNRCLDYLVQYHYLVGLRGPELERS